MRTARDPSGVGSSSSGNGASEYLTVDEAAAYLKVKPSTVRQWIREGRLPCYPVGAEGDEVHAGAARPVR